MVMIQTYDTKEPHALLITRLTPGVLLPPDHRHELNFLIPITLLDMTTITEIDHGMSLSVLFRYNLISTCAGECD
jgi:hypothetical protein